MELKLHPLAQKEIRDAIAYYEKQELGLGRRFRHCVYSKIDTLQSFPQRAARVFGPFRRLMITRFPYGIVYKIDGNLLIIIAIAHQNRKPNYWHDRIS